MASRGQDEYAERLKRGLRSRLSHELRTPLNSIITLSQLLIEDGATLTAEQRRYLEVIRRNGRNLLSLVDQIAGSPAESTRRGGGCVAARRGSGDAGSRCRGPPRGATTSPTPHAAGPVLLIEDDPIERQRIGSFIEAAGYDVTRAASGEEGLSLLRAQPFAAVVLDLVMPEMTGLDVLRAARTEDRLADIRFIVLSAMYMTKNERDVLGPEVTDVVRKGETMPRALTFALHRAVKPTHAELHAHHGDGGGHTLGPGTAMTASWRAMMTSWRLPKWPRRFAYPAAGLLLSLAMIAGLLTVEASTSRHVPTISWIFAEVRTRPVAYAYLLVATLMMMSLLGWMVGRKEDLLGRLSTTDPLTGLANRRRLRSAFADELNRAARYETPLSLLLVDLDRLKDINDRHGHGDGDRALQLVAEALRRTCRATDLAARYGGDEFVVLAVNTPATEARVLALRIRDSVRRLSLRAGRWSKTSEPINHTVSIGAADLAAAALPTFDALHAAADRALYAAKSAGRDGVMVAPTRLRRRPRRMRGRAERRHRRPQTTRRPMTLTSVSGGHGLPR